MNKIFTIWLIYTLETLKWDKYNLVKMTHYVNLKLILKIHQNP